VITHIQLNGMYVFSFIIFFFPRQLDERKHIYYIPLIYKTRCDIKIFVVATDEGEGNANCQLKCYVNSVDESREKR
jgi:hypothetical protein